MAVRKPCNCENCNLPTLEYECGQITVFNEHRGKKHINKTSVLWIVEQAVKDGLSDEIARIIARQKTIV